MLLLIPGEKEEQGNHVGEVHESCAPLRSKVVSAQILPEVWFLVEPEV